MKTNYIKSFPTIDQCVVYLTSIGCKWNHENELKLQKQSCFKFKNVLVLYDPYNLLAI
jgi:hypothetical protein